MEWKRYVIHVLHIVCASHNAALIQMTVCGWIQYIEMVTHQLTFSLLKEQCVTREILLCDLLLNPSKHPLGRVTFSVCRVRVCT